MKHWLLPCFLLLIGGLFSTPSTALSQETGTDLSECIVSFEADYWVHTDCSMTIHEKIVVNSLGIDIHHGIYREIPLYYEYQGGRYDVYFELVSVLRDGKPEQNHTESASNGIRIYFGSKDYILPVGEYTYELTYKVNHIIGFFKNYDELYWNANGTGWLFSISSLTARVHLPKGATIKQVAGYTGTYGSTSRYYTTDSLSDGIQFSTTKALQSGENLSFAVAWKKGVLSYPSTTDNLIFWLKTHLLIVFCGLIILLLLVHNLRSWIKYGIDPKPGVIVPQYGPPDGFSAGDCCFVYHGNGHVQNAFTAELVSIAVKGHMSIEMNESGGILSKKAYTFTKEESTKKNTPLSASEKKLYQHLFASQNSIYFKEGSYNPTLKYALAEYGEIIAEKSGDKYHHSRMDLKLRSFGIMLIGLALAFGIKWLFGGATWVIVVYGLLALLLNLLFAYLYNQPTALGRKILDHLEGFKLYMQYADKERIRLNNPPTMNFDHFEENLPYAIALGVSKEWSDQFDPKELETGFAHGHAWYGPMMVYGLSSMNFDGLSSSISSASTPPSSSSGSGGGGFSGGGGGGGGGGGW